MSLTEPDPRTRGRDWEKIAVCVGTIVLFAPLLLFPFAWFYFAYAVSLAFEDG